MIETRAEALALRALWDLAVVAAEWEHPGYRMLRQRRLVTYKAKPGTRMAEHRLTERGRDLARSLFECRS